MSIYGLKIDISTTCVDRVDVSGGSPPRWNVDPGPIRMIGTGLRSGGEYNWTTSVPEIKQCIDFVRDFKGAKAK